MAYDTPYAYKMKDAGSLGMKGIYVGSPIANDAKKVEKTMRNPANDDLPEVKKDTYFPKAVSNINGHERENMKGANKGGQYTLQIDYDAANENKPDLREDFDQAWIYACNKNPPMHPANDMEAREHVPDDAGRVIKGYAEAEKSRWVTKPGERRSSLLLIYRPTVREGTDEHGEPAYFSFDPNDTGKLVSLTRGTVNSYDKRDDPHGVFGGLEGVLVNEEAQVKMLTGDARQEYIKNQKEGIEQGWMIASVANDDTLFTTSHDIGGIEAKVSEEKRKRIWEAA